MVIILFQHTHISAANAGATLRFTNASPNDSIACHHLI